MKNNPYSMVRPCDACPFGTGPKAVRGLGTARAEGIRNALLSGQSFHCHKTVKHDDDGEAIPHKGEKECAGAMILLERIERPNQMMRVAERIGMYDMTKLEIDYEGMVKDFDEFVESQSNPRRP